MKFELPLDVPEGNTEGLLVIETFHATKDQFTFLSNISLHLDDRKNTTPTKD